MAVVPISPQRQPSAGPTAQAQPTVPPATYALMAAAQMHSEGRLVKPNSQAKPVAQPTRR